MTQRLPRHLRVICKPLRATRPPQAPSIQHCKQTRQRFESIDLSHVSLSQSSFCTAHCFALDQTRLLRILRPTFRGVVQTRYRNNLQDTRNRVLLPSVHSQDQNGRCHPCTAERFAFQFVPHKGGQEPIVHSTLRAIWLLVPDPFYRPISRSRIRTCDH